MLIDLLVRNWATLHGLVVAFGLAFYVAVSRTLPQRRDPSAAIAWVVALALLPYLTLPLFVMIGSRKLLLRDPTPQRVALPGGLADEQAMWAQRLGRAMGLADAASCEGLSVHADGADALRALDAVIAGAARTLDVCTFILARDAIGDHVAAALKERARAGVDVRLMVDGIGALMSGRIDYAGLRAAGVHVVNFVPPFRAILRGRANLRNHRKMVVADGVRLWCGGRNFAADYFEGRPGRAAWHDLSFDLGGALAAQARRQFELDWAYATRAPARLPADAAAGGAAPAAGARLAQLVPSGPDQVDDTVQVLLVSGCFMARRRILAVTPYFVPESTLLQALTLASRRGVAVDLVLPARSNHRLADLARNRPLRALTAAGARVWLAPRMVHAKAVVVDDELALAGSANLDARSLFLNYELMLAFYDAADVSRFAAWIDRERADAVPYAARPPGLARDLAEGLVLWLAFQL